MRRSLMPSVVGQANPTPATNGKAIARRPVGSSSNKPSPALAVVVKGVASSSGSVAQPLVRVNKPFKPPVKPDSEMGQLYGQSGKGLNGKPHVRVALHSPHVSLSLLE